MKKRRFLPRLDSLEDRELLSSVYLESLNTSNPRSVFIMNGDTLANGHESGLSATVDGVVGGGFSLDVYQETYARISSVAYTMPNCLNGDGPTGYGINSGGYAYRTSDTVVTTQSGPSPTPLIHEYFDNRAGTDVIMADVKYASSTNIPDEIYRVTVNVKAPTADIITRIPTVPGTYGIGATDTNGNAMPWVYNPANEFGVGERVANSLTFAGIGNNTTSSTGFFFFTQTMTVNQMGSNGYLFNGPLGTGFTPYSDRTGAWPMGLDELAIYSSGSLDPIATWGYTTTARAGTSVVLRGVGDNPGIRGPMSYRNIPYQFVGDANFTTYLCFEGWSNSIPVSICSVNWHTDYNYLNTKARDNATTANAFGNSAYWVGASHVTQSPPINNNPQLVPGYNFNVPDRLQNATQDYPAQGADLAVRASIANDYIQGPFPCYGYLDYHPEYSQSGAQISPVPSKWDVKKFPKVIYG